MFNRPSNIFKRAIAVIIDQLIILILLSAIYIRVYQGNTTDINIDNQQYIVFTSITIGYFFLFEWFFHKTIGKKIMGLKVIRTTGQSPDFLASFIRNIIRPIDFIGFYLLGFIFVSYTELNQRIGDLIAGTYVIEE